ncbi:MAG TPA: Uma2 family endonuclease [Blastocatellia bacterium]|nr:Uma2 family endonuclease [Blastocatellia bacterium]
MTTTAKSLVDELYEVEGKAEIVNGEIVKMSPAGKRPGLAAINIIGRLLEYKRRTKRGYVFGDNVGFTVDLPDRDSFSPDVAWYAGELGDVDDPDALDFIVGPPTFAVEIRSKNDYGERAENKISKKIRDYFTAGTLAVWDVDLRAPEPVKLYLATDPANPIAFKRGELAHAEPVLPGWTFPVDELFRH